MPQKIPAGHDGSRPATQAVWPMRSVPDQAYTGPRGTCLDGKPRAWIPPAWIASPGHALPAGTCRPVRLGSLVRLHTRRRRWRRVVRRRLLRRWRGGYDTGGGADAAANQRTGQRTTTTAGGCADRGASPGANQCTACGTLAGIVWIGTRRCRQHQTKRGDTLETTAAHRELLRSRCVAQAAIRQQIVAARWISAASGIHVLVLTVMSLRICRGTWWCRSQRAVAARRFRSAPAVAADRSSPTVIPDCHRDRCQATVAVRPLQTDRLPDHCQPAVAADHR